MATILSPDRFRPSLTAAEISFLIEHLAPDKLTLADPMDEPMRATLVSKLRIFSLKTELGATKPAHVPSSKDGSTSYESKLAEYYSSPESERESLIEPLIKLLPKSMVTKDLESEYQRVLLKNLLLNSK